MMKFDLSKRNGTIAKYLTEHLFEFNSCGTNLGKLKAKVSVLLDADELKNNPAVKEAKLFFSECKSSNQFLSLLGTYATGIRV